MMMKMLTTKRLRNLQGNKTGENNHLLVMERNIMRMFMKYSRKDSLINWVTKYKEMRRLLNIFKDEFNNECYMKYKLK